jgi:hypothetical protein
MSMEKIERLARGYAEARGTLAGRVGGLEDETAAIKRRHLPGIKRAAAQAADARLELEAAVETDKALFKRPRTRILHGIRVGWMKAKGKISFEDAGAVVALIRRHLPGRFDELVRTTETPVKPALARLTGAELKKIGVAVAEDSDQVLVSAADGEIDRLVDALLAAHENTKDGEAA